MKVFGSRQSYCNNKQAYFFGLPVLYVALIEVFLRARHSAQTGEALSHLLEPLDARFCNLHLRCIVLANSDHS